MDYNPLKTVLLYSWELGNHDAPIGHALVYAKDIVCGYVVAEISIDDPAEYALSVAKRRCVQPHHLKDFELAPPVGACISHVCINDMQDMIGDHLHMEDDIIPVNKYVTPDEMRDIVYRYAELYYAHIAKIGLDAVLENHLFFESKA
jgi:hypothetical protein